MDKISSRILLLISLVLVLTISTVQSQRTQEDIQKLWNDWLTVMNPSYINDPVEKARRFENFKRTIAILESSNDPSLGLTKFADFDDSQIAAMKGYLRAPKEDDNQPRKLQSETPVLAKVYPKTFDWRDYEVVSSVKEQGLCGAAWAYSTAAFFQSELVRRKLSNNQVDLAEQFLLECQKQSFKCNGGYLGSAIDLILKNGIPYENQFPINPYGTYKGVCDANVKAFIQNSTRVTKLLGLSNDEIKELLLQRPLNIAVATKNWNNYAPATRRIFKCSANDSGYAALDHTVLLVGWTENQWIIKNQWGSNWGDNGYIYVSNSDSEDCGIGWEVHTLNFELPPVDTANPASLTTLKDPTSSEIKILVPSLNPLNLRTEVPVALVCPLPNCQTCYFNSPSCTVCKDGFQLNTLTKTCYKGVIPNCVEFNYWAGYYQCVACQTRFELSKGACAVPGFNAPPIEANKVTIIDAFNSIPSSFFTQKSSCELNFCQTCYDNGKKCYQCMPGYAVNQRTDACEKSPIDGCGLFVIARDAALCFECKKGYRASGYLACIANTP